jgi:beta-1,4-mannosyltransferase
MESFVAIRDTTNPYQTQLVAALREHVDVATFSWRAALLGRFDVLHVHWPEVLVRDTTSARTLARQLLYLLLLVRIRIGRKALVRTLHNIAPHESGSAAEGWLLRLGDRWTTCWIALNEFTPVPSAAPSVLIPHGHYRDWFAGYALPPVDAGRLLHFGRIRRYKGLAELLAGFRDLADPALRLRIVGRADDPRLAQLVRAATRADDRITADQRYVAESDAATEFGRAELVVLPYPQLHNSGVALLALSLGRPVLVPDNTVTRALAAEVGSAWVIRYDGTLDARALRAGVESLRSHPPSEAPDLRGREWQQIGRAHAAAFEHAVHAARASRRSQP